MRLRIACKVRKLPSRKDIPRNPLHPLYWLLLYISKTTVVKMPYIGSMLVLVILVIIGLKFDCFYNWAVLIPLAFTKPLAYAFLIIESRKK